MSSNSGSKSSKSSESSKSENETEGKNDDDSIAVVAVIGNLKDDMANVPLENMNKNNINQSSGNDLPQLPSSEVGYLVLDEGIIDNDAMSEIINKQQM